MELYETLPIVPLRDVVVFPHMMMPFVIGRPSSTRALEHALLKDKRIFLAAQHAAAIDDPQPADIFTMGCVANIVQSLKLPDGNIKVLVEGIERARAVEWKEGKGFYRVVVKVIPKHKDTGVDAESTMSRVVSLFEQYVKLSHNLHYDAMIAAVRVDDPGKLADTIAAHLLVGVDEKQNLLEIISPVERLNRIAGLLEAEVDKLQVDRRSQSRVKKQMEQAQKEYCLNERMKGRTTVTFLPSSRGRLTRYDLGRFPGETLFDRLGRAVCRAGCLPRKELFEAWEVARRVRRLFRGGRVIDLGGGHGLLAQAMLILDNSSPEAIVVDRRLPPSAPKVHEALLQTWPRLTGRVSFVAGVFDDVEIRPTDVVVSSHACGALTDRVLDRAAEARARVAVLPCCHDFASCDAGELAGWVESTMAIDIFRAVRLQRQGYRIWTQTIPGMISPKNRLLLGAPSHEY
jgi:Lon protease-like protein